LCEEKVKRRGSTSSSIYDLVNSLNFKLVHPFGTINSIHRMKWFGYSDETEKDQALQFEIYFGAEVAG
jgi:hypothetical protein